jgi:hypothetical protein
MLPCEVLCPLLPKETPTTAVHAFLGPVREC